MRKRVKSNFLLCITAIFLFVFSSIQIYANDRNVLVKYENTEERGSISVELTEGRKGTSRENVEFSCTKVGEIFQGKYILKDDFFSSGVNLNEIESAKDLEEAAEKLAKLNISAEKVLRTDKNGKLCFQDLPVGVYFLEATDATQYEKITPFLINIPTFDEKENEMIYDIRVIPKHEPEPGKITTDSPGEPGAPQTGFDSPILKYFAGAAVIMLVLIVFNISAKKVMKK